MAFEDGSQAEDPQFRIATYNVHGCRGMDGVVNTARIAEVIRRFDADVVALQELDVGRKRSNGVDQAAEIARHLSMHVHFNPAHHVEEEKYGDAILSRLPCRLVRSGGLPSIGEPRGALWVEIEVGGSQVQVINTHLGLRRRERMMQVEALLGPLWAGAPEMRGRPCILTGDFNAVPPSTPFRTLARAFGQKGPKDKATFPSRWPILRLDHIFVRDGLEFQGCKVLSDRHIRLASDHLPVVASLAVGRAATAGAEAQGSSMSPVALGGVS